MKQWICEMCGYTHQGNKAPKRCPRCGASKSMAYRKRSIAWNYTRAVIYILLIAAILSAIFGCNVALTVDNSTVDTLNVNRYIGRWYEIARFDHRFERGMSHCTATYELQNDGTIKVTNRGLKDGKWKTSIGKAKTTQSPGVLRVSFFGPFYADYRVMMLLDTPNTSSSKNQNDYSCALVGGGSDDYLWILSRRPQLSDSERLKLVEEAKHRGYHTEELIWPEQDTLSITP